MSKTPYEDLEHTLARTLFIVNHPRNMTLKDWDSGAILGAFNIIRKEYHTMARAAIDTIHARTMLPSAEMTTAGVSTAGRSLDRMAHTVSANIFQAMHAVGPTAKPSKPQEPKPCTS